MDGLNDKMLQRIADLAIREDQKDDLIAEFHRRRRASTLEGFAEILDLPWGVLCEARPDVEKAKTLVSERGSYVNLAMHNLVLSCAQYALLQQQIPRVTLPSLSLYTIEPAFHKKTLESLQTLLGRPVEAVVFSETTTREDIFGSADAIGCVMAAVKRANCCNPVILLENIEKIKDKRSRIVAEQLKDHRTSHSFVDESIGVPFDLSNVIFIVVSDVYLNKVISWHEIPSIVMITAEKKILLIESSILPPILTEYRVDDRKHLFDEFTLRAIVDHCVDRGFGDCEKWIRYIAFQLYKEPKIKDSSGVLQLLDGHPTNQQWDKRPLEFRSIDAMPVGGAPLLGARAEKGSVYFVRSSFSEECRMINETMKKREMVHIAYEYCRAHAERYSIPAGNFEKEISVDFPPVDGYSVGCATFLSVFSLLSNRRVRSDSVTTGKITLSGRVLKIGGVHEKTYATYKAGIRRIVIPEANRTSVKCSGKLKEEMTFEYVETVDELVAAMMMEQ